ncbi:hypothetical protein EJB05_12824, partial [Eragrostis curvula]
MAGITPLLRLLPLLLLLLHPSLREYLTVSRRPNGGVDVGANELHPIVLLAGLGCSDIEARLTEAYRPSTPSCGAMKGKGWFSLWENATDLVTHDYLQCFEEQMRLVYDPAVNDYRNLPGVETRIPKFGSVRGKTCLDHVREALEGLGYRDNDTMFGVPYGLVRLQLLRPGTGRFRVDWAALFGAGPAHGIGVRFCLARFVNWPVLDFSSSPRPGSETDLLPSGSNQLGRRRKAGGASRQSARRRRPPPRDGLPTSHRLGGHLAEGTYNFTSLESPQTEETLRQTHDVEEPFSLEAKLVLPNEPYDWRHTPPIPGQASRAYSHYFQQFKELVEAARIRHQKMVIIFGHSYGGMVALEFVRNMPPAWRNRYIKHLIPAAPTLSVGFMYQVRNLVAAGSMQVIYVPDPDNSSVTTLWTSFETAIFGLPSPTVFGHEPIVVTKRRNYFAYDMEDLLAAFGLAGSVKPFRRRMVPKMRYSEAPMVPITCINGLDIRMPRQLVFWDGDYGAAPEIVYGDGDGFVNLISMSAFEEDMCGQPRQKKQF